MFYRIIFKIKNEFRYFRWSKCEFEFFNFLFPNVFTLVNDIIFFFINPFFNNRLCVVCNNKFTPAFIWMLIFRGNNLNLIAAMQYGIEGNNLTVYFCTDTMKSNFTMNFESKINRRGVNRQTFQIAFRRENINLILIKIKGRRGVKPTWASAVTAACRASRLCLSSSGNMTFSTAVSDGIK